ncbi:MAG: lysophospholipid acyltransferase family protein [Lachnospira sp.]
MRKKIYYTSYTDDVVKNSNQDYKLKPGYKWINNNIFFKIESVIIYGLALVVGYIYCKLVLHIHYKNRKVLKENKDKGYFIYANHTQPFGDVVIPAIGCIGKRIYVIVSQSNYGLPVIGPLLPQLGALPVPDSIGEFKKFKEGYITRINQKHPVVVYPEAHVWPYYNKIRPFELTSFRFPAELSVPAYAMTTTYQKRRFGKGVKTTVYFDGPFEADANLSIKENQKYLHDIVYDSMLERSTHSTYSYYEYLKSE